MTILDNYKFFSQSACEELEANYKQLPGNYFQNKDALHYCFNNINRALETSEKNCSPPTHTLIHDEFALHDGCMLYSGVPWCENICAFCNFAYSKQINAEVYEDYINCVVEELRFYRKLGLSKVYSVYFGGGTPTVLDPSLLERYLCEILRFADPVPNVSVTCETSPNTLTSDKLEVMKKSGVTRLSMGVQCLDNAIRKQARLVGTADEVEKKIKMAKSYFDSLNVDLIYGYPNQTLESWFWTVKRIASMEVPSIVLYRLEVKRKTSNWREYHNNTSSFLDELTVRQQYFIAQKLLERAGYVENPLGWWILNPTKKDNLIWKQHLAGWEKAIPYIGIGQGAFSMFNHLYHKNHNSFTSWRRDINEKRLPIAFHYNLEKRVQFINRILRLIRTTQGINLAEIEKELCMLHIDDRLQHVLDRNTNYGLFDRNQKKYILTLAGRSLVHWILDEIVLECR